MRASDNQRTSYIDFEIEVGHGWVRAESKLAGETRATFTLPYGPSERDDLRRWLEQTISVYRGTSGTPSKDVRLDNPQRIGEKLFEALFQPPVYSLYEKTRAVAVDRGVDGLRLKLRTLDDVALLPWELLYDPRDDYLALTPRISLVRYLEAAVPIRPIGIEGPLRILLIAGAPDGLDLSTEIRSVREALRELQEKKLVVVESLERATIDSLLTTIRSTPFHIVHFMGHSAAPGPDLPAQLFFADESGGSQAIEIDSLWRVLRRAEQLRLIWLNSCSSAVGQDGALVGPLTSAAARFVTSGVPAVIANQLRISDSAAIILAQSFYTNLAQGLPVDVALAEARMRVSVRALKSLEWATPVLYMRAPDGVLFQKPDTSVPQDMINSSALGKTVPGDDNITIGDIVNSTGIAIGRGARAEVSSAAEPAAPAEDLELKQLLQKQLQETKRRLAQRELQRARYGISADPSILIEIEDLKKEILSLQRQIDPNG